MKVPQTVIKIKTILSSAGAELYLVGGCVRDYLLGLEPKDYDMATNYSPDRVISLLEDYFIVDTVGAAFGVVLVKSDEGDFEIATYRKDVTMGRNPLVEFSTIGEDVKRRDFTINAMFYDLFDGSVIDLVGGKKDLESHTLKTVGNSYLRFQEDALRKLRAVRFATKLGFSIDSYTKESIQYNPTLEGVSRERIVNEFLKTCSYNPNVAFATYKELNLLKEVLGISDYSESKSNNLIEILSGLDTNLKSLGLPNDLVDAVNWYSDYLSFQKEPNATKFFRLKRRFNEKNSWFVGITNIIDKKFADYQLVSFSDLAIRKGLSGKDINTFNETQNFNVFNNL